LRRLGVDRSELSADDVAACAPAASSVALRRLVGFMVQPALVADRQTQSLAERLVAFRGELDLTPAALAGAVGATAAAVRRWEAGTARPSAEQAGRLGDLGMADISGADTNAQSLSRLGGVSSSARAAQARAHRAEGGRRFRYADEVWDVIPAPYVLNGPPDQGLLHDSLLRLQMEPARAAAIESNRYSRRLSVVDEVDGQPTSQALLEGPKPTATAWNSNYGSHGWHRYVGRFPPHLVRVLLNHFQAQPGDVVLDPFAGSGTTNVECRLLGIPSVGVEISPLSALIARTKSGFPASPTSLLELSMSLADHYSQQWSDLVSLHKGSVPDHAAVLRRPGNLIRDFQNHVKWLTPEALLGISIVTEYAAELEPQMRDLLLVALSSKMRSIGNVDVDVVRAEYRKEPRANVDVLRHVRAQLKKMATSVDAIRASHPEVASEDDTEVIEGNILDTNLDDDSIAHVITSPPYGVESLSYLRTHLLSFRCLESFLHTDPYATGAGVIGSEYMDGSEPPASQHAHAGVSAAFNEFFGRALYHGDAKLERRAAMMMKFFDDMGRLVGRLGRCVRPGGCVGFVIGNKRLGDHIIPAHTIIAELFAAHGFELNESLEHKLKTNNSNSQVPWQERIIQNEYLLVLSKR
jgi:transcriptional regulator with XRE-family HTH domain